MSITLEKAVKAIDWKLLRKQKDYCVNEASNSDAGEIYDGIVNLIDVLQDAAVKDGIASEETVFGLPVRQKIERKVVRHLIRTAKAKGWEITRINDGGEPDEDTLNPTEEQAMDTVFSVDESVIYFRKQLGPKVGKTHFATIILGNDGYDCIADHSCSSDDRPGDDFEQMMDEVQEYADKFDDSAMGG